ncbi:thioredoxin-like protein 4A isoform X1 [Tachyglossus aculeatus]|nr:thioredoxin-like protein 4A isoform X1 [Tachyglossus aculeatus]
MRTPARSRRRTIGDVEAASSGPAAPLGSTGGGESSFQDVVHASSLTQRLAGGPGHPVRRGPSRRHQVKNFAVIYLVDITEVPDFNKMYELYDPCTVMFFFRNKHIMIDLGTGNNNKINWAMEDKQEMIDIIETVYRGARKGRGLVVSPKDYSTKYRY